MLGSLRVLTPKPNLLPSRVPFTPSGNADKELEWFFTMAESDMGDRSNYMAMVGEHDPQDDIEARAESAHAQRAIVRWLWEVGDRDAGVLKAAYAARPWPLALREELGRVTGIVVRLASAEVGLPDEDAALDDLERRTADRLAETLARLGRSGLERHEAKARSLLGGAFASYVRERGGKEKPVLRGVS
jgi:hypothetical protein